MAQINQIYTHTLSFINAFSQCNASCQEVQDQLVKGILMNTTHNLLQVIQLLTLQFDNLLMQMNLLQAKVNSHEERIKIDGALQIQQCETHPQQSEPKIEPKSTSNIYDLIFHFLKTESANLKGVIHLNIVAKNSLKEMKYANLLDNNIHNDKILEIICQSYNCQIFILNLENQVEMHIWHKQKKSNYQYLIRRKKNNKRQTKFKIEQEQKLPQSTIIIIIITSQELTQTFEEKRFNQDD